MKSNEKIYFENKKISIINADLREKNDGMNIGLIIEKSGNIRISKLCHHRKNVNKLIIFEYIYMLFLFDDILSRNEYHIIKYYSNAIKLKLKIIDSEYYYNVYSPHFNSKPNEVYINDKKQSNNGCKYFFNLTKDSSPKEIKLIWDNKVTNCGSMFYSCYYISSIDLSSFDMSEVKNMSQMFSYCLKLNSLTLANLDTSKVIDMSYMFAVTSLSTINFVNFKTSNVENMSFMFSYCINLLSL